MNLNELKERMGDCATDTDAQRMGLAECRAVKPSRESHWTVELNGRARTGDTLVEALASALAEDSQP